MSLLIWNSALPFWIQKIACWASCDIVTGWLRNIHTARYVCVCFSCPLNIGTWVQSTCCITGTVHPCDYFNKNPLCNITIYNSQVISFSKKIVLVTQETINMYWNNYFKNKTMNTLKYTFQSCKCIITAVYAYMSPIIKPWTPFNTVFYDLSLHCRSSFILDISTFKYRKTYAFDHHQIRDQRDLLKFHKNTDPFNSCLDILHTAYCMESVYMTALVFVYYAFFPNVHSCTLQPIILIQYS